MEDDDKYAVVLEPFRYLQQQPGKEIRSQLVEAFDAWLHVPPEKLAVIKSCIEMLHNASLLIDDVEDGSLLRRGKPVAHKIYGVPSAINCANLVYFMALRELGKLHSHLAVDIFTDELIHLHQGQGMDIFWRDSLTIPSEEEYLDMINNKTGGLLRLAVNLMQACSDVKLEGLVELVNTLGILYQVRDDYINLVSSDYMKNKSYCEDLTEGKFSFPIIHSLRNASSSNRQLLNILRSRTSEIEVKTYAVQLMHDTGSFEYTKQFLHETVKIVNQLLQKLGDNAKLKEIVDYLGKEFA